MTKTAVSEQQSALSRLFEDIHASEVKYTALSRRPYYDYHSMLYKDVVEQAAAEIAALRDVVRKAYELVDDPRELTVRELANALARLDPK